MLAALGDPEPHVREHALATGGAVLHGRRAAFRTGWRRWPATPTRLVRYQLAFSLGALPGRNRRRALAALAVRDGADPWMRVAILSSVTGCAGEVFRRLAGDAAFRASAHGRAFLTALAAQTGASDRPDDLAAVLKALDGPLAGDRPCPVTSCWPCMSRMSAAVQAQLAGSRRRQGRVDPRRRSWPTPARPRSTKGSRPPQRAAAVRSLRFAALPDVQALLSELLAPRQPPAVQTAAIETLARFDDARVPAILLRGWPGMSPKLRATAAEALFARPAWVGAFLDAVEKGTVGRADVDPARLELLKTYPVRRGAGAGRPSLRAPGRPGARTWSPPTRRPCTLKGDRERGQGGLQDPLLVVPPPRRGRPAGRRRPLGDPRPRPGRRAAQHPRPQPRGDAAVPELRPRHDRAAASSPA